MQQRQEQLEQQPVLPPEEELQEEEQQQLEQQPVLPPEEPGRAACCDAQVGEALELVRMGWPNSLDQLFCFMPGFVTLAFVGPLGPDYIAAAGMGFMVCNITGTSIIMGVGLALTPLASQAFGAGNYPRCGQLLWRNVAIHALACIPIGLLWLHSEAILLALQQPPTIARLTATFIRWRIPSLPFLALTFDLRDFMLAQRTMVKPMLISIASNMLNVLLLAVLVDERAVGLGFIGAPIAMSLSNAVQCIAMLGLFRSWLAHPSAFAFSYASKALSGWGEMMAIAMPSSLMVWSEWWGWEVNLFLAGLLCAAPSAAEADSLNDSAECKELSTFPILSNTMVLAFMATIGFSIAVSTQVGNLLGAGRPGRARAAAHSAVVLNLGISGVVALVLIMVRKSWARLFTDDEDIIKMCSEVLPVVAAYIWLDAAGPGALNALLRSAGLVCVPAVMTCSAFYVIGIPIGALLAFKADQGVFGLWLGLLIGMSVMVSGLLIYMLVAVDWKAASLAAVAKASRDNGEMGMTDHGKVAIKLEATDERAANTTNCINTVPELHNNGYDYEGITSIID